MFNIGIEIEFLLVSLEASKNDGDVFDFSKSLAEKYNQFLLHHAEEHPKMHDDMSGEYDGPDLVEWALEGDVTIETEDEDMPPCMHYHPAASTYLSNLYITNAV